MDELKCFICHNNGDMNIICNHSKHVFCIKCIEIMKIQNIDYCFICENPIWEKIFNNQEITNQKITNKEITNKEITNKEITNKEITNKEITNKEITNKEIMNQKITNYNNGS